MVLKVTLIKKATPILEWLFYETKEELV